MPSLGEGVGETWTCRLDTELNTVQSASGKPYGAVGGEPDPAGDQLCIDAEPPGASNHVLEVSPEQWLSTREMHLDDPQLGGLPQYIPPFIAGQLLVLVTQLQGFEQ